MPKRLGSDDDLPAPVHDWTIRSVSEVPPWRREDRDRLDRARSSASDALDPAEAVVVAAELRRLSELYKEGAISTQQLVEAVRAAVAKPA